MKKLVLIVLNVAVLAILIAGLEVAARWTEKVMPTATSTTPMFQNIDNPGGEGFYPYVMSLASSQAAPSSPLLRNNFGFTTAQKFDLTTPYDKRPNERIIIFLGGSAAWGYGASSNDKIVHQRLEALLNERQHDIHYTVVSLAMQNWIAQQSAIALDIWGRLFRPDWVVTMNGFNDSIVGCLFSQGTGNPNNGGATKLTLMGAYQAALGRSEIEQTILRNSALYRRVTGKVPMEKLGRRFITKDLFVDPRLTKDLGQLAFTVTPLSEVRNQTQFYLLAQQSIIERYPDAKYLVTTEAMSRDFDAMFARTPDEIEKSLDASIAADPMCSLKNGEIARRYVFVRSAQTLEKIVGTYRERGRDIEYFNMGTLFPRDNESRIKDFADDVHLRNSGHEMLAQFYASRILARDFPSMPRQ
jgi:hypothetical protein